MKSLRKLAACRCEKMQLHWSSHHNGLKLQDSRLYGRSKARFLALQRSKLINTNISTWYSTSFPIAKRLSLEETSNTVLACLNTMVSFSVLPLIRIILFSWSKKISSSLTLLAWMSSVLPSIGISSLWLIKQHSFDYTLIHKSSNY